MISDSSISEVVLVVSRVGMFLCPCAVACTRVRMWSSISGVVELILLPLECDGACGDCDWHCDSRRGQVSEAGVFVWWFQCRAVGHD